MSQSAWIFAALLAGFVCWLAMNNRLTAYTAVVWGGGSTAQSSSSSGQKSGGGGFLDTILGAVGTVIGGPIGGIAGEAAGSAITGQ